MTGKTQQFDDFFVKNYQYLLSFTKSIDNRHDYESTCHDVYIKLRERIDKNGFEGTDFLNYTRVGLINNFKYQYRKKKNKYFIDLDNPDYYHTIENRLHMVEDQEDQERELDRQSEYLNTMIFEYVDQNYSPKECFIFRTYYLLKHRHLNYKQLSEVTGISITSVSNTIKKLKKDIKLNIREFILSGETSNGKNINV